MTPLTRAFLCPRVSELSTRWLCRRVALYFQPPCLPNDLAKLTKPSPKPLALCAMKTSNLKINLTSWPALLNRPNCQQLCCHLIRAKKHDDGEEIQAVDRKPKSMSLFFGIWESFNHKQRPNLKKRQNRLPNLWN